MEKRKKELGELLVTVLIASLSTTGNFHGFVLASIYLLQQKWEEKTKFLSAVIGWLGAMPIAYAPVIEDEQVGYS